MSMAVATPSYARPLRGLLGLTVVVALVHLLLLAQLPAGLDAPSAPTAPPVFSTRSLPPPSASPQAPAPDVPAPTPSTTPETPAPPPSPATPAHAADAQAEAATGESRSIPAVAEGEGESSASRRAVTTSPAPVEPAQEAPAALSAKTQPAARLHYDLTGHARGLPYHAEAELLWQHEGQRYNAQLDIKAFLIGSRSQTSEGEITPQGLAPRRFADKARNELAAHFHRDTQLISFSANTPDAALQPGAQDKLSIFLQLGALLGGQPQRWPVGSTIALQVVGAKQAEPWQVHVDAWENLRLPSGEVRALKLTRPPRGEFDPRIEVWVAPSLYYLPVRIRLSQTNGDVADQLLSRIDWLSSPPPVVPAPE